MSSPLVSIVIPVYNAGKFIRRCLDSVLSQGVRDIEIICVNDGSTDDSSEILKEYAARDPRIVVISRAHSGLAATRNAGIEAARAEFITFVDADDYVDSSAYQKALAAMSDDVDYVCFGIRTEGHTSAKMQRRDEKYYAIRYSGKVEVTEEVLLHTDVSSCNKIFRKSLLKEHDIAFPTGLRYEDAFFFSIYGIYARAAYYIPTSLYVYTRHADSIMAETFAGQADYIADHLSVIERIHEHLVEHKKLSEHFHFFGKLFFKLLHTAIGYEPLYEKKIKLYEQAESFLLRCDIDFSLYPDLVYPQFLLEKRIFIGSVQKRWGGLICKKYKGNYAKLSFCGIPLMKMEGKLLRNM